MLPEELSNGLCSLNPEVDRLCFVCDMTGIVARRGHSLAIPRSCDALRRAPDVHRRRGILATARPRGRRAELKPALEQLQDVYRAFARARHRRGAIDFDLPETKMELDDQGKVRSVRATERLVTHKIIEECMIAANVQSAKRMLKVRIPGLYRVHEGPDADRLEELVLFLKSFDYELSRRIALLRRKSTG